MLKKIHNISPKFPPSLSLFKTSKIDTPELLEKLKVGDFAVNVGDIFTITSGAHEHVLSQPKHFGHSKYHTLRFMAADRSFIEIRPQKMVAAGFFYTGMHHMLMGMPADYIKYFMHFAKDVMVDKEDVAYMYQWSSAKMLSIMGESAVAVELQQHLEKMKELYNVHDMHMDVAYANYMKLRAKPFMDNMHSLHKITFYRHELLSMGRFEMFVKSQTIPSGWKCNMMDQKTYTCMKN